MAHMDSALADMMSTIEGAIGVALVDYTSGMALATLGDNQALDLNIAAAGNTDVVRAKMRTMEMLELQGAIEDMLITLTAQYHIIRPVTGKSGSGLFLYLVLDRKRANLALARHRLARLEADLEV
ncbi:hypothetical protein HEK616_39720 [Streptomyces nigrescens]|uniref:Roadblock/LAMTOR2 domain-containing protein n=2 Tax=Streptomyces TaxID=1883 RepID=A0ABN6QYW3_STRNI|nr:hypothetical protein [Streptomyces nigrescens]MEE4419637.1 hypothetical protein [Streptomyces sp. DSM 41528]BDM70485.1 hypothetical protein HEK616_39720 [Streptomyces nigrescens]